MASQIIVDGTVLTIPEGYETCCWEFTVFYQCGHIANEHSCGHIRTRVIRVKHHNHAGPCWMRRCAVEKRIHVLRDKCYSCNMWDLNMEGYDDDIDALLSNNNNSSSGN
ncbi:hypothetical protein GGR54DRAFT_644685 [Hypoxylon sp. NC1633]|nr:hypothetical protein GGR54DRAFT_644685 [Hypoxylon sp. NC1633]